MAGCRIKAFASHAQAFRRPARVHPWRQRGQPGFGKR
jgi:hypothetical protein